jgi:hypothetical protein
MLFDRVIMNSQTGYPTSFPHQIPETADFEGPSSQSYSLKFGSDRLKKYGWGMIRLTTLLVYCFYCFPLIFNTLISTQTSRLIIFAYFGAGGAIVNTRILSKEQNFILLGFAILLAFCDLHLDPTALIFVSTTLGGDFLASKLDTLECKTAGIITITCALLYLFLSHSSLIQFNSIFGRVWFALFIVQAISEYGDHHLERFVFFRHRYAFEVGIILILGLFELSYAEALVICLDLVSCLFYRISNFTIIVLKQRLECELQNPD